MSRRALIVFFLVAAAALADRYPRQDAIDILHYDFQVTLRDDTDEIAGETTMTLRFLRPGLSEFALDLAQSMAVTAVTSSGAPVSYVHSGDRLVIRPTKPSDAREERSFLIRYHGTPAAGLRIGPDRYRHRSFFSSDWPDLAHQWLPVIDHPYDKAASDFHVIAPTHYQVVSNGVLVKTSAFGKGQRITHWRQAVPIAVWQNAIAVAQFVRRDFDTVAGIPLQTWVYPQDRESGTATFEEPMRRALSFYTSRIGPYPYAKLASVEAAGINGGMEHASAIFFGEDSVGRTPATDLVAHEVAHQWFGDSVTEKDWDEVWLSEGFATYFALLVTEIANGRDAFAAGLKRNRELVFAEETNLPGVAVIHRNPADLGAVLNRLVYEKGAWVLHMLRRQVGDAPFWAGIREYYRRYRDANASTDDFRAMMEEQAGSDLRWFFDQWLYRPGTPVIEGAWQFEDGQVLLDLSQTQPGEPYRLNLEIAFDGRTEHVDLTARQQRFQFRAAEPPSRVVLDPGTNLLFHGAPEIPRER